MNSKIVNVIWGAALIILGGLFLAQQMQWVEELPTVVWLLFFAGLSVMFFASYFLRGPQEWGWLFPACIFAGLTLTIGLSMAGYDGSWLGTLVLGSIAAPFFVVYLRDTRNHWWAVIPGIIMGGLALVVLLEGVLPEQWVGFFVMLMIALPFFVIYLTDRKRWWALIPAGVLSVISVIPLLTMRANANSIGGLIMLLMSAPFLFVYLFSRRNWWAIIPAGIFLSIGLALLLTMGGAMPPENRLTPALIFFGWAITFLVLWLLRTSSPTAWAIYPAGGLALVAVGILSFGEQAVNWLWPALIIAAGVMVLFRAMRRKAA